MENVDCTWSHSPPELDLSSKDVHVWFAGTDDAAEDIDDLVLLLSADEWSRAARFHFEQDRKRYIVRRALLRLIVSRYAGIDPARLEFHYGSYGKPSLAGVADVTGLNFNLSHSRGWALYALTHCVKVGVDLEWVRPVMEAEQIAQRNFSVNEASVLSRLPDRQKLEAFFNCWTRKEAYLKALGDGLARPLDSFEVSLRPREEARLLRVAEDPDQVSRWSLCHLSPAGGCIGALAIEEQDARVSCWRW
jgi:4'-phosphopantetheinyl transferase